jgi:hypothetical protein
VKTNYLVYSIICFFTSVVMFGVDAYAQCTKDTDCKNDRICNQGNCVEPLESSIKNKIDSTSATHSEEVAPQPLTPKKPIKAPAGYSGMVTHIAGILNLHGWGKWSYMGDEIARISSEGWGGLYLSAYGAINPYIHLGGFFSYLNGNARVNFSENVSTFMNTKIDYRSSNTFYSFGISWKYNWRILDWLWISLVTDFGPVLHRISEFDNTWAGFVIAPRVQTDFIIFNYDKAKMGLFTSLGVNYFYLPESDKYFSEWYVFLQMLFGVTLGL